MSHVDKVKWDQKYRNKPQLLLPRKESHLLHMYAKKTSDLSALDLACGSGRNSLYLANCGYRVEAIDIAGVALEVLNTTAKEQGLEDVLSTRLMDLASYQPPKETFELIIMMNFLDRALIKRSQDALKVGGRYIVETYMASEENEKSNSKMSNLLQAGELKSLFDARFEVLYYDECHNEEQEIYRMKKQMIVVEKRKVK